MKASWISTAYLDDCVLNPSIGNMSPVNVYDALEKL
jgi:hypothetical protein